MNSLVNSSRAHVADPGTVEEAAHVVTDGVQEVGLAQPGVAVDEQRVVGLARRFCNGDRSGVREPVRGADDEGLEDVLGIEPRLQHAAGPGRRDTGVGAERSGRLVGKGICRFVV